jgi:WD40 repeat protein
LGPYQLLEELGSGGMGAVYRARDPVLQRDVALKVILTGQFASQAEKRRFAAEAAHAAHLDHPNIVPVLQSGETDGRAWFAMKLIDGAPLLTPHDSLPPARWHPEPAARLIVTIARAVHHAHQRGILHRDLKPANILIDQDGRPHVTDFGLARRLDDATSLTVAGSPVGTPGYMAPECVRAHGSALVASDVWSLGAILHQLVAGSPPFAADHVAAILDRILHDEPDPIPPPPPGSRPVRHATDFQTILSKCLQKDPTARYASAAALADDLERWLRGEPLLARPISPIQRTIRWARRKPAQAALLASSLLLLLLAVGGPLVALRLNRSAELERIASANARDQLHSALVAQANGHRLSLAAGRREAGLRAVRDAARIRVSPALRDAAIALLALIDLGPPLPGRPGWFPPDRPAFDGSLSKVSLIGTNLHVEIRSTTDGSLLAQIPPSRPEWSPLRRLFTPDGSRLLADDQEVLVSSPDFTHWERRHPNARLGGVSPDSRVYAVLEPSNQLILRELASGDELARRSIPSPDQFTLAFDPVPAATRLLFASANRLTLWDWSGQSPDRNFDIGSPAFSIDWAGNQMVAGLDRGGLWFHDLILDRSRLQTSHRGLISSVRLSPSGSELLTWSHDGTSTGWQTRGAVPLLRGSNLQPVAFASDGSALALRTPNGWGIAPVQRPSFLRTSDIRGTHALHFSTDGAWIFAGGNGGLIIVDAPTGTRRFHLPLDTCTDASPLPDGIHWIVASRREITRWRFQVQDGQPSLDQPEVLLRARNEIFESGELFADGRTYWAPTFRSQLHGLSINPSGILTSEPRSIPGVTLPRTPTSTPDARWLATGTFQGFGLEIRDLESADKPRLLARGNGSTHFSPNGQWLLWAGRNQVIVFETGSWKPLHILPIARSGDLPGHGTWSTDGRLLAITREGQEILLLHAGTWETHSLLRSGDLPRVSQLRFSPDNRTLAVLTDAEQVELRNLDQLDEELARLGIR